MMENTNTFEKISPFAYHDDEVLFLENPTNGYVSEFNVLTPLEQIIVESINCMLVATSSLIHRLVQRNGMEISKEEVNSALSFLAKRDYVKKYLFKNPDGSYSATRCYILSTNGKRYLARKGIRSNMTGYVANCTPCDIKELLSTWQLILNRKEFSSGKVKIANIAVDRGEDATFTGHIFRTHAFIDNANKSIFIESVRSDDGSEYELIKKISRMDKTLRESKFLNINVALDRELIIVCEDIYHRERIKEAIKNSPLYPCFQITITDDVTCYHDADNCLEILNLSKKKTQSFFKKIFAGITA